MIGVDGGPIWLIAVSCCEFISCLLLLAFNRFFFYLKPSSAPVQ
jgi:hypothetical protein